MIHLSVLTQTPFPRKPLICHIGLLFHMLIVIEKQ